MVGWRYKYDITFVPYEAYNDKDFSTKSLMQYIEDYHNYYRATKNYVTTLFCQSIGSYLVADVGHCDVYNEMDAKVLKKGNIMIIHL